MTSLFLGAPHRKTTAYPYMSVAISLLFILNQFNDLTAY
ncbi:hypothetical protein SSCHL_2119 [Staphylococcus schleiferi]|nr:hypothetical protein SSCHL_2119 [Staphylococcus schleiferi]